MYKYNLGCFLVDCPVPWQHFIKNLQLKINNWNGRSDRMSKSIILGELRPYNVVEYLSYTYDNTNEPYLIFEEEQDALAFILKWT